MKTFCIYHRVDFDGKCSAAIVLRKHPEAILIPYNYGDDLDIEQFRDARVFMVDCCVQPFDDMIRLAGLTQLTWIDHHKTAIENYEAAGPGTMPIEAVLEIGKAGCELTGKYFFPNENLPRAVWLLGRYDVWDLDAHPDVLAFQYGMRQNPWQPVDSAWPDLFNDNDGEVSKIIDDGHLILKYAKTQNKGICCNAFEANLDGLECICVNGSGLNSQAFESVWDSERYDAMLAFYSAKGKHWTVGLYTDKPGVDVGAVAKARGGGGHLQAAGFQCTELPSQLLPTTPPPEPAKAKPAPQHTAPDQE